MEVNNCLGATRPGVVVPDAGRKPPSGGDVERFGDAMAERRRGEEGPDDEAGLRSEHGRSPWSHAGGAFVPASGAPVRSGVLSEGLVQPRCQELVERILVSQPTAENQGEVRIKLDSAWLPETEVRMTIGPDRGLSVEFLADNVDSQRFLLSNLSSLQKHLAERSDVPVSVVMSERSDADSGDGRSRNRRNLFEEREEK